VPYRGLARGGERPSPFTRRASRYKKGAEYKARRGLEGEVPLLLEGGEHCPFLPKRGDERWGVSGKRYARKVQSARPKVNCNQQFTRGKNRQGSLLGSTSKRDCHPYPRLCAEAHSRESKAVVGRQSSTTSAFLNVRVDPDAQMESGYGGKDSRGAVVCQR